VTPTIIPPTSTRIPQKVDNIAPRKAIVIHEYTTHRQSAAARLGLSGTPSLLRLCCQFGVAKVVWATCGAAGCVGSLPMAVLWRQGAGCYHNFERVIGIVQSSESLHRLSVGVVTALFGRRSPCRGHHGEVLHSRRVGFSGETSSIWMCDGGTTTS
jgi:hypothetical protein